MLCNRCDGLMVEDAPLQFHAEFYDLSELEFIRSYRCLACGNIEDPTIKRNRLAQAAI